MPIRLVRTITLGGINTTTLELIILSTMMSHTPSATYVARAPFLPLPQPYPFSNIARQIQYESG